MNIEKVVIDNKLVVALVERGISFDKVMEQVMWGLAKKTDMELMYVLARIEFYGTSSNATVEYELLFNEELEQVELEIRLWTLEIENTKGLIE